MATNTLFNETELAMFQRQTGFNFGDFFKTDDGVLFAIDKQSGQVFIGRDLLKANVHDLGTVASASLEDDGITVAFKNLSSIRINAGREDAEAFVTLLGSVIEDGKADSVCKSVQTDEPLSTVKECSGTLRSEELTEFYSRLANTGRSKAIGYLVSETGMSVDEACAFLDKNEGQDTFEDADPDLDPDYLRDGTMTKRAILETVKKLKPYDRIHLEFKPLIGKLRTYDAEYRKLEINVYNSKLMMLLSADVYQSLMDDAAEKLFDYMDLFFFCEEDSSEMSCHLKKVTMLKILGNQSDNQ